MAMQDMIQGKWKEIKGDIRRAWGKLTDDELDQAQGDAEKVAGLLQQRYGMEKDEAKRKVDEVIDRYVAPDSTRH